MDRYDIIIIGTGPGGISAAITAKIRNKKFLLVGSRNLSEKMQKAEQILNYPGFPAISGKQLCENLSEHLSSMNIEITEKRVGAVYAMGEYFAVQMDEDMVGTETVILATGVVLGKPLEGEEQYLGNGVSYCATCDAPLYKGKNVIVLGYNSEAEAEAKFLSEIAAKVTYFPVYKESVDLPENIEIINEKPKAIFGSLKAQGVKTDKGEYNADGIFVLRDNVSPEHLVPGLKIEDNHVSVNLKMETNLPGLFACGDITGRPYQYIKAAGQGNVAALSAVAWLDNQKAKK